MINPADDEINILLSAIAAGLLAFLVTIGVVVYKVFDLRSAIGKNGTQERVGVVQATLVSIGGVIFVAIGYVVLTIVIEIMKGVFARLTN